MNLTVLEKNNERVLTTKQLYVKWRKIKRIQKQLTQ